MSTTIANLDLSGQTVSYNGIIFDGAHILSASQTGTGSSVSINITPPTYSLETQPRFDEADRIVIQHDHRLTVTAIIHSSTEPDQNDQVQNIRRRLLEAGGDLSLSGLGLGFPESNVSEIIDISWGPKPRLCTITPFGGQLAHEIVWVLDFSTPPCLIGANKYSQTTLKSLNYETTWSNDLEGVTTRTISGFAEILEPQTSRLKGNKTIHRAEKLRGIINFPVPTGFKRLPTTWRESADKDRLDFSIVDQELRGDAYPDGIIKATGSFSESFDPFALAENTANLVATLTVAKGIDPSVAAARFLAIALTKQASMTRALGNKGSVIADSMTVQAGLFDEARTSSYSIRWLTTGCIASFLFSTPWEQVEGTNSASWATSIVNSGSWNNRGFSQTQPTPGSDAVINVCSSEPVSQIGATTGSFRSLGAASVKMKGGCTGFTEENSWLRYDVQVKVKRTENTSLNRFAVDASTGDVSTKPGTDAAFLPRIASTPATQHVIESNGFPEQFVVLQMKGLRIHHKPVFPTLTTVGGQKATPFGARVIEESVVTNIGGCLVHSVRGYQIYVVQGYIASFKEQENERICVKDSDIIASGSL